MRVVIAQKDLKNLRSGVSRLVRSQLEALDAAGGSGILISEKVKPLIYAHTRAKVTRTLRWPFKGYFRRQFFRLQAEYLIRKYKPDVSVCHGDLVHADVCFIHNCVHLEHEILTGEALPKDNDVGLMHSQILLTQAFRVLVCNSEMMKQDLCQRFNIRDKRVAVLYPSCDPENVMHCARDVRQELAINEQALVIGLITSGNFKKRNVAFFLEVARRLESEQEIHIVVAGNGKEKDYQDLVEACPHSVHFLPSTDNVADYYACLDVFVLPAYIEEFGMSALEAMTCGKPVVLHRMVGASEILEGESIGYALPNLELSAWVKALNTICTSTDLRGRLGQQNADTATKYTAEKQNTRFIEIIDSLNYE